MHSQPPPPPAYLHAPTGPAQAVTYYSSAPPNMHPPQPGSTPTMYATLAPGMQAFAISPSAGGTPMAMGSSSGTAVLVAPTAILASSAGGAPGLGHSSNGAGGSFAAPSSGHGSFVQFPHGNSLPTPLAASHNSNNGVTFRNLKIGGLPPSVTDTDLYEMFQRFGKIESAKVMLNVHTCESRGYGFVLYDTQEAGCRAFGEMNGKVLTLRGIEMTLDVKNSDWDGRQAVTEINAIYVRNIPNSVSDEELKKYFGQFGTIANLSTRTAGAPSTAPQPGATTALTGVALANHTEHTNNNENAPQGSRSIEQQLHSMLDDDEVRGTSSNPSGDRVSPAPSSRATGGGPSSLNAEPPTFASFDFSGDVLGKLAMVEFNSIDSARAAIAATHRQNVFPNASTPVLSKFADAPHVKEQRRNQRKQQQQLAPQHPTPVNALTTLPPTHTPPQQFVAVVGSSFPSNTISMSSSHNAHHHHHIPQPRHHPEAAPLPVPLPRPGTTHRLYYQGLLGLTSDGQLYPIRPDVCVHVVPGQQDQHQQQQHRMHHVPPHQAPYHTPIGTYTIADTAVVET